MLKWLKSLFAKEEPQPPQQQQVVYTKEQAEYSLDLVIDGCWQSRADCIRMEHQGMAALFREAAEAAQQTKENMMQTGEVNSEMVLYHTQRYIGLLCVMYPSRAP